MAILCVRRRDFLLTPGSAAASRVRGWRQHAGQTQRVRFLAASATKQTFALANTFRLQIQGLDYVIEGCNPSLDLKTSRHKSRLPRISDIPRIRRRNAHEAFKIGEPRRH